MRTFVDTNVLLDVLTEREPFLEDSVAIWSLAESGRAEAHISALSVANCWYVVKRQRGMKGAEKAVRLLKDVFRLVDLAGRTLTQALDSGLTDFEDAIQYVSALHCNSPSLVTRNASHFPKGRVAILSPREFLSTHDLL